jgi:hypothetical protein
MLTGTKDARWRLIEECRPTRPDPDAERLAAELADRLAQSRLFLRQRR